MTQPPSHHTTYILDLFSDQTTVRDLVRGILHTIFFHRYFPSIKPSLFQASSPSTTTTSTTTTTTNLPIPLPAIHDPPEIGAAIDTHVAALMAQLTSSGGGAGNVPPGGSRGEIVVQFFDRKRRKTGYTGGWLGRLGGGGGVQTDEEVCWEEWCLQVVVARPRSEADRIKVRRAMESSLTKTAMKIVAIVNRDKDHIPPITTSDQNPFPYRIEVNPKKQQQNLERGFGAWN